MLTASATFLDEFATAIAVVGTRRFEAALLQAICALTLVDHLTILTYQPTEGLRTLGVASRVSLSAARSLTRDYVATHHVLDPNFAELASGAGARRVLVRQHDPRRLKTKPYQERFYTGVGIIDKISYIWQAADVGYYVNFYRTLRSGHFVRLDAVKFSEAARFVSALVRLHSGRKRVQSALGGASADMAGALTSLLSDRLTKRESEVLVCILQGMRTEGIAIQLGVKPASIVTFRKRAYTKLGIATQAELFACCLHALPAA